jgi:lipid-A-disaccharide synthase
LPNLILGRSVVPELKQRKATVDRVFQEARALLEDPNRAAEMSAALSEVVQKVSCGDSLTIAADAVINLATTGGRGRTKRPVVAGSGN